MKYGEATIHLFLVTGKTFTFQRATIVAWPWVWRWPSTTSGWSDERAGSDA